MFFFEAFFLIMGIVWIIMAICIAIDCSDSDCNYIEFLGKEIKIYYAVLFILTISALNFALCAQICSDNNCQKDVNIEKNIQQTEGEFISGDCQ